MNRAHRIALRPVWAIGYRFHLARLSVSRMNRTHRAAFLALAIATAGLVIATAADDRRMIRACTDQGSGFIVCTLKVSGR